MRLATYRAEKNITELARRLYRLDDNSAPQLLRNATTALLRANPHLERIEALSEGTLLVVPQVTGLAAAADEDQDLPLPELEAELAASLRVAIEAARTAVQSSAERAVAEAEATLALIEDDELKRATANAPELQERLKAAGIEARDAARRAKDQAAAHEQDLKRLSEDLERGRA